MTQPSLPFKSRTQTRDFSTLAVYRNMIEGAMGQTFNDNLQLAKLPGFRRTVFFKDISPTVPESMEIVVFHNVRAYCRKDAVEFIPVQDDLGMEMIKLMILGDLKGYAEPLD